MREMNQPQQEPEDSPAVKRANYLFVLVLGVVVGAIAMAIIASNRCEPSNQSPQVVYTTDTREVTRVVGVPKVVTREIEVTREVEVMRVVTRVVTKEIDSPSVATRAVEVIDGTPTTPTPTPYPTYTPTPPNTTPHPPTLTPSVDVERCELWRDYGATVIPLILGLLEVLAAEVDLLVQAEENPPVIWTEEWQAKVRESLTESDFSARTISRTKAPDQFERRTRPIDTVVRSLLERNTLIRNAFDNPESAEDWQGFVPALRKVTDLMKELYDAQVEEALIQFDMCGTIDEIFQTDPSPTLIPSPATTSFPTVTTTLRLPPAPVTETTSCDVSAWRSYALEIKPLVEEFDEILRDANRAIFEDQESREDWGQLSARLVEVERAAYTLLLVVPAASAKELHNQLTSAVERVVEGTRIFREAFSGTPVSDSRMHRSVELYINGSDGFVDAVSAMNAYSDGCKETAESAASIVASPSTPSTSTITSPSATTCDSEDARAYLGEMLPIAAQGLGAFQRTENLVKIVESNPFAVQDVAWRSRMETALDDMDEWASATINIHPTDTMSEAHQFFETAARLYMERVTPIIRRGITNTDSASIRSVIADAYQAAGLLNQGTDYIEDRLERCE